VSKPPTPSQGLPRPETRRPNRPDTKHDPVRSDGVRSADGVRPTDGVLEALQTIVLGWEEWVALPDIGLPALKAKIDTGAKTSALHASSVQGVRQNGVEMVLFRVQPARRRDLEILCQAPIIDQRDIISSNGEKERRFVIETTLVIGARSWPIEVTLTNRASMTSRMLLGRQALADGVLIDPARSYLLPRLGYGSYGPRSSRIAK
jgi:ribosomal protein S6--L-glutamate ligase